METNLANHLTELCRYALKHFLRRGAPQLFFLEVKQHLQYLVLHFVHLKKEMFQRLLKQTGTNKIN